MLAVTVFSPHNVNLKLGKINKINVQPSSFPPFLSLLPPPPLPLFNIQCTNLDFKDAIQTDKFKRATQSLFPPSSSPLYPPLPIPLSLPLYLLPLPFPLPSPPSLIFSTLLLPLPSFPHFPFPLLYLSTSMFSLSLLPLPLPPILFSPFSSPKPCTTSP